MQTFAAFISDPIAVLVVALVCVALITWLVRGQPVSVRAAAVLFVVVVAIVGLLSAQQEEPQPQQPGRTQLAR